MLGTMLVLVARLVGETGNGWGLAAPCAYPPASVRRSNEDVHNCLAAHQEPGGVPAVKSEKNVNTTPH